MDGLGGRWASGVGSVGVGHVVVGGSRSTFIVEGGGGGVEAIEVALIRVRGWRDGRHGREGRGEGKTGVLTIQL